MVCVAMADHAPQHPMAVVTRRTGLGADVIRAWERRHRAVEPARSPGNHRLYTDDDIRRLLLIRQALEAGWHIGQVASLSDPEIEKQFPRLQPCRVVIETTDGRTLEKRVDYALGDPRDPIDDASLDRKFSAQAETLLSAERQAQLKEAIFNLDRVDRVSELMQLTVRDL